jgi:hypothetical protein
MPRRLGTGDLDVENAYFLSVIAGRVVVPDLRAMLRERGYRDIGEVGCSGDSSRAAGRARRHAAHRCAQRRRHAELPRS